MNDSRAGASTCAAARALAIVRYGAHVIALADESIIPLGQGGYVLACVVIPDQNISAWRR